MSKVVRHVLLAEFDIDRGSVLRHQYPSPCGVDDSLLAEQMLPDGAHNHAQDWTIFFLHRPSVDLMDNVSSFASGSAQASSAAAAASGPPRKPSGSGAPDKSSSGMASSTAVEIPPRVTSGPSVRARLYTYESSAEDWVTVDTGPSSTSSVGNDGGSAAGSVGGSSVSSSDGSMTVSMSLYGAEADRPRARAWLVKHTGGASGEDPLADPNPSRRRVEVTTASGAAGPRIAVHDDMSPSELRPMFLSVYSPEGKAYGFLFETERECAAFKAAVESALGELQADRDRWAAAIEAERAAAAAPPSASGNEDNATSSSSSSSSSSLTTTTATTGNDDAAAGEAGDEGTPFLYCLNLVLTKKDSTVRRGAVVKAMALCCTVPYFAVFKPLVLLALERYYTEPTVPVLAELFDAINNIDLEPATRATALWRDAARHSPPGTFPLEHSTKCHWNGISVPVRVPLATPLDSVGDASLLLLLRKFGDGVMDIFNAVLLEKRVLFVGHGRPAGEVCRYALSAALLVAPPLTGLVRQRVFPYCNLVNLGFLEVPGYIAGVTNPMFESKAAWWDLVCDLDGGRVTRNPGTWPGKPRDDPHHECDAALLATVQAGVKAFCSEAWVKDAFEDHAWGIVEAAFDDAVYADDAARLAAVEANASRVRQFKRTHAYIQLRRDRGASKERCGYTYVNLHRRVRTLRVRRSIALDEFLSTVADIKRYVREEDQLYELLSLLPASRGGYQPLTVGLFHAEGMARRATAALLSHIASFEVGKRVLQGLDVFVYTAYERAKKELGM